MILIHDLGKIRELNSLIRKLDKNDAKSNSYSLYSMKAHAKEIEQLFLKNDPHWAAETVDLLIHCLLLLQRNHFKDQDINKLVGKRYKRFEEKILAALENTK